MRLDWPRGLGKPRSVNFRLWFEYLIDGELDQQLAISSTALA